MKIVQINTVCGTGSTGKIAASLYNISLLDGLTPFIAYGRGKAPVNIQSYKIGNPFDFGCHVIVNFFEGKSGFGSKHVTKRFLKWLDTIKPDILHLHNLHGFYIHVGMLFEYIKGHNISVVWTMHDCWPLTGQCAHFDYAECNKWKTSCFSCPIYRTNYPYSLFKDNSKQNYIVKRETFTKVRNMIIVTPSNWLASVVKQSFLSNYPIVVIPNGIDLDIFKPFPSSVMQCNPKIILGVANIWSPQKGLNFFLELYKMLDSSYQIVLIGVNRKQEKQIRKMSNGSIITLTRTANQTELARWYSRAYAYVNPTLEDTFPTTNLEALACGTPVITFNTGGSPESITSKCGLVVDKGNVSQLYAAILSLEKNSEITSSSCRECALAYDKDKNFDKYLHLYRELIKY